MNPEQVINKVKEVLDKARPVSSGYWVLVLNDDSLELRPHYDPGPKDKQIAILTSIDVNEGLTPQRWNTIGDKLCLMGFKGGKSIESFRGKSRYKGKVVG